MIHHEQQELEAALRELDEEAAGTWDDHEEGEV